MPLWLWVIIAAVVALVLLALATWLLLRVLSEETRALAARVGRLPWRAKARLAWALFSDARVPLWLRAIIPALVLYLALPIDIIPDFIPVIGYLDDLLIVALAAGLIVRLAPRDVVEDHLSRLEATASRADS